MNDKMVINESNLSVNVSGKIFAIFTATSISMIVLGILTYVRKSNDWLIVYDPTGHYGGIFLYCYILWTVLWLVLYLVFRKKENMGGIKFWLIVFIVSTGISTGFIEASLSWKPFL